MLLAAAPEGSLNLFSVVKDGLGAGLEESMLDLFRGLLLSEKDPGVPPPE